jgi:hypothetical protein
VSQVELIEKINKSNWTDFSLKSVQIDFDKVTFFIDDPDSEKHVVINCEGYIGFSRYGHWDESILESIQITGQGDNCKRSLSEVINNYGEKPLPGGGYREIFADWHEMVVKFIDGSIFSVSFLTVKAETL